jgi:hypothetical protein
MAGGLRIDLDGPLAPPPRAAQADDPPRAAPADARRRVLGLAPRPGAARGSRGPSAVVGQGVDAPREVLGDGRRWRGEPRSRRHQRGRRGDGPGRRAPQAALRSVGPRRARVGGRLAQVENLARRAVPRIGRGHREPTIRARHADLAHLPVVDPEATGRGHREVAAATRRDGAAGRRVRVHRAERAGVLRHPRAARHRCPRPGERLLDAAPGSSPRRATSARTTTTDPKQSLRCLHSGFATSHEALKGRQRHCPRVGLVPSCPATSWPQSGPRGRRSRTGVESTSSP